MSMKRCGNCRREYRAAGTRAVVDGERKIVCPKCAKDGIVVCTSTVRCTCGKPAAVCTGCAAAGVDKARKSFDPKKIADGLRAQARVRKNRPTVADDGIEPGYINGLADGLTQAADYLASGRWA